MIGTFLVNHEILCSKMNWGKLEAREEIELETVNGLRFKKYQMSWIRDMARKYNQGNVNEFIINIVLTDLRSRLEKFGRKRCMQVSIPYT